MTKFEDVLETILEEYARRDSEGEFDTWEETDAFVKEKAEVLLAYVKEEPVSKQKLSNVQRTIKDCKEEPISEDLEKISYYFACMCHPLKTAYSISSPNPEIIKAFKAGAKWQFKKVTEALLSEVLPCFMHGGEADEVVAKLDEVLNFQKK